jgi:hypothetical protein
LGFIEEETEFYPTEIDIGGVQGKAKLFCVPFTAVMDGVNLKKVGFLLVPGVMGTDMDMFLRSFPGLVPLIPRGERFFRSAFKTRSMVAGLIRNSLLSGVM